MILIRIELRGLDAANQVPHLPELRRVRCLGVFVPPANDAWPSGEPATLSLAA